MEFYNRHYSSFHFIAYNFSLQHKQGLIIIYIGMSQDIGLLKQDQQSSICPTYDQQRHKWCTYEVTDTHTAIIQWLFLIGVFILLVMFCKYSWKVIRYRRNKFTRKYFSNFYVYVYFIIFAWILCSISRIVICNAIFYAYMYSDFQSEDGLNHNGPDPHFNHPIVIFSSVYTFFNFTSALLVNFLVIIIPYQWRLKTALLNINENESISFQIRKILNKWFIALKIIRFYLKYLRNVFFIIDVLEPILFFTTQIFRCSMPTINYTSMVIDSGLIMLLLAFGAYISNYLKEKKLIKIDRQDEKKFIIQYALIAISSVVRIALNLYMIYFFDSNYSPNQNCSDRNIQNDYQQDIVLILHHVLMHLLPISIVLYIYRPNVEKQQIFKSLLDSQSSSNFSYTQQNYQHFVDKLQRASMRRSTITEDDEIKSSSQEVTKSKSEIIKRTYA